MQKTSSYKQTTNRETLYVRVTLSIVLILHTVCIQDKALNPYDGFSSFMRISVLKSITLVLLCKHTRGGINLRKVKTGSWSL